MHKYVYQRSHIQEYAFEGRADLTGATGGKVLDLAELCGAFVCGIGVRFQIVRASRQHDTTVPELW